MKMTNSNAQSFWLHSVTMECFSWNFNPWCIRIVFVWFSVSNSDPIWEQSLLSLQNNIRVYLKFYNLVQDWISIIKVQIFWEDHKIWRNYLVKLIYSEKVTKIWQNLQTFLTLLSNFKYVPIWFLTSKLLGRFRQTCGLLRKLQFESNHCHKNINPLLER